MRIEADSSLERIALTFCLLYVYHFKEMEKIFELIVGEIEAGRESLSDSGSRPDVNVKDSYFSR